MLPSYAVKIEGRAEYGCLFCNVKLLPEHGEFENHLNLKARLTHHLQKIIKK